MPRSVRLGAVFLASAGLVLGAWFLIERGQNNNPPDPDGPKSTGKLVVLVVFDQMRGDYLARWAEQFGSDGFERMKKDGVWYSECHLPYACTSTGPGHASLVTGAPPSVHGIIENDWYDRAAAGMIYCVQPTRPYDRVPPLPGAPAKPVRGSDLGFSPERLLVETVGDRLQAANAESRVVSLSLKDRSMVLMGGKKPTAAYCFDTRDGLFHTGAYYRDAIHPWVAEVNGAGVANRWVGKEWTRFRTDLDYDRLAGRDDALNEGSGAGQKRVFPHPMGSVSEPGPKYYAAVEASPFGNEMLFELMKAAIAAENLGSRGAADLLCVSFSSNDIAGHHWGPDSWEVLDLTLRSDRLIADLLKHLDEKLGPDRYVLAIAADHGVCPIPEQKRHPKYPAAERVPLGDVMTPLAAALEATFGNAPAGPTRWFEDADGNRMWPWIYLNHAAIKARKLDPAAVADYAAQWVGNRPFMLTAFTRTQIETNMPPPVGAADAKEVRALFEKAKLAYHPDRAGDVIGVPKPGVLISGYPSGTNHGSPHAYDTHIPLLLYGAGVPALGKRTEPKSSLIVAPTVAALLGIDPPAAATEKPAFEVSKAHP